MKLNPFFFLLLGSISISSFGQKWIAKEVQYYYAPYNDSIEDYVIANQEIDRDLCISAQYLGDTVVTSVRTHRFSILENEDTIQVITMFHLSQDEDDEYFYESEGVRIYSTISYDRNEKLTTTLFREWGDVIGK